MILARNDGEGGSGGGGEGKYVLKVESTTFPGGLTVRVSERNQG